MLTEQDIGRISRRWKVSDWPLPAAGGYAEAMHSTPFAEFVARVRHLGIGGDILIDAGCGVGTWAFALLDRFQRIIACDFNTDRIATARWLQSRFGLSAICFSEDDIRSLPADDASADAVYSNSVALGAVPLSEIMTETLRVLRPGGVFFLSLNALGYGYSLATNADPRLAYLGRRTIYNTYGHTHLGSLVERLRPSGALNAAAISALAEAAPVAALTALAATPRELEAARAIENDLGPEFAALLSKDLMAIVKGDQTAFTHSRTARGYEPENLRATAAAIGFERFAWAPAGRLSVQEDGSVEERDCPGMTVPPARFAGHLRVFENLMWKPG